MKFIFFILLLISIFQSNGQSKSDTEEWLLYNLDKYFENDLNGRNKLGSNYKYNSTRFKIIGSKFIYTTTSYHVTSESNQNGVIIGKITTTIDLTKLIKVAQENAGENPSFNLYYLKIFFEFNKNPDFKNPSVIEYDELNNKNIKEGIYSSKYQLTFLKNEPLKNNLPARIVKAFEHLAELNGAKIVKDVF